MEEQAELAPKDWQEALQRLTRLREHQNDTVVDVEGLLESVRAERMAELERRHRAEAETTGEREE